MTILSRAFWVAATERALKSAGQMLVLSMGTVAWTDIEELAPAGEIVGLAMLFGALLSYGTSMASAGIGNAGPSLANEALVTPDE